MWIVISRYGLLGLIAPNHCTVSVLIAPNGGKNLPEGGGLVLLPTNLSFEKSRHEMIESALWKTWGKKFLPEGWQQQCVTRTLVRVKLKVELDQQNFCQRAIGGGENESGATAWFFALLPVVAKSFESPNMYLILYQHHTFTIFSPYKNCTNSHINKLFCFDFKIIAAILSSCKLWCVLWDLVFVSLAASVALEDTQHNFVGLRPIVCISKLNKQLKHRSLSSQFSFVLQDSFYPCKYELHWLHLRLDW